MTWIRNQSLWLVGLGLMLASSGIDGEYMAKWMPGDALWLGYVLNTVSDICGMVLTYWWGRLRQFPSNSKRYKLAMVLLPAEIVTVAYSWFFSWRQLRLILPRVEGLDAPWVAPIAAGFIPLLLAFVGYAQSLLAGRLDTEKAASTAATTAKSAATTAKSAPVAAQNGGSRAVGARGSAVGAPATVEAAAEPEREKARIHHWRKIYRQMNGDRATLTVDDVADAVAAAGLAPPSRRTMQDWKREAQNAPRVSDWEKTLEQNTHR